MKKRLMTTVALSFAACDEPASVGRDAAPADVDAEVAGSLEDVEDASEDAAVPDARTDTAAPDTPGDLPVSDDTSDAELELPDATPDVVPDATDADAAADIGDVEDVGTECDGDELCEAPYVCIDGACQLSLGDITWAESDFDITEPEELTPIFELFKSFATDVKFMVLDFGLLHGSVDAEYGTGDIVDAEVSPVVVRWQDIAEVGAIGFVPLRDEGSPLSGDSWVSDEFFYQLRASATIGFPGLDTIVADFGLDAMQVTIELRLDPLVGDRMIGRLSGLVTREETESRDLGSREDFDGLDALFCDVAGYDPGPLWQLSDVLDCNEAVLDADSDGDGVLDAYRVVIDAEFELAELVP